MHNLKHSRDELLQDFCIFGDYFICGLLRQRQNPLHSIAKTRGHLVILVLFLQELQSSKVTSASGIQVTSTNFKSDAGNTKGCLCNWIQLQGINFLLVLCEARELTSAKTAPYLIALSTDFSVDPLISGEYSFSSPSSSWSDERRASTYAGIISWRGWAVAKVRTVSFAESCTTREKLCFPMTTPSVPPDQKCADSSAIMTNSVQ